MSYHGDIRLGDTLDIDDFCTAVNGVPTTLVGGTIAAYVGNSLVEILAGLTLTVDFDGRIGCHHVRIVATAGNGFAAGTNISIRLLTGTVNGVTIAPLTIGTFSIQNRSALTPAALVGGRMDASVGAMAPDVMTAAAAAADLTTELQSGLATAAALNVVDDFLDTEIAAIKAKTDTLPASPANEATLVTIAGYLDTEILAIKAKTDLLPAAPAAVGDIPTALQNADAYLARDLGSGTLAGVLNERTVRAGLRFSRNKFTIAGGILTVYKEDDTTIAWTAVITQTAGNPVSACDPV